MSEYVNFKKACNLNDSMTHKEKYRKIVDMLGFEEVKQCIPFTYDENKKAYAKDVVLNNLSMRKWDFASGFECVGNDCRIIGSRLMDIAKCKLGVNVFSNAGNVCVLKECARM